MARNADVARMVGEVATFRNERDAAYRALAVREDALTAARVEVDRLRSAVRRETADHLPSAATGLPCKCFLCTALRPAPGTSRVRTLGPPSKLAVTRPAGKGA